jgi:hypothetical protein
MLFKKFFKLSSINIITGLINFFSTIIIVKIFGLFTFGEFAIFSVYIALLTIFFSILPPNYSVMKLQDNVSFLNIIQTSYFLFNILITIFISIIYYINSNFLGLEISIWIVLLYIAMYSFFNFIDIKSQATNTLNRYYIYLLVQSILKLILLGYIYYFFNNYTLDLLLIIFIIPQLLIFIFHITINQKIDIKNLFKINDFTVFLIKNFKDLKKYYIEIVLKRIKDNIIVLIFSNILSKEVIGLYALLIKVGTFVLSQVRILEAMLMNKENLKNSSQIDDKIYLIAFLTQCLIITVGIVYLKLSVDKYYLELLVVYSFIAYPYLNVITIRNNLYAIYKNALIINSLVVYNLLILLFSFLTYIYNVNSIYSIIFTILISETISMFYLKILFKRR